MVPLQVSGEQSGASPERPAAPPPGAPPPLRDLPPLPRPCRAPASCPPASPGGRNTAQCHPCLWSLRGCHGGSPFLPSLLLPLFPSSTRLPHPHTRSLCPSLSDRLPLDTLGFPCPEPRFRLLSSQPSGGSWWFIHHRPLRPQGAS